MDDRVSEVRCVHFTLMLAGLGTVAVFAFRQPTVSFHPSVKQMCVKVSRGCEESCIRMPGSVLQRNRLTKISLRTDCRILPRIAAAQLWGESGNAVFR